MKPSNDKIIVSVNYSQKKEADIGGITMQLAKTFNTNGRERNPVVCRVDVGNGKVKEGQYLLVHHNRFVEKSPHHLGGNQYSLAYNQSIFARIDEDGSAMQMCGNIIVERIYDIISELVPEHLRKTNSFKFKVLQNGYGYKKGQYIFCDKFSDYEIIYVFGGKEYRIVKVYKDDIVGKLV